MTIPIETGDLGEFLDLSLDLFCIIGLDGRLKLLNRAWEQTTGFSLAELQSKPYVEFVHPKDREATLQEFQKPHWSIEKVPFESRALCKDGSYRWLRWTVTPNERKKILFGIARDITERKGAEQRLSIQYAVADLLATSSELRESAPGVLRIIGDMLSWDKGEIWLVDRETNLLRRLSAWHPASSRLLEPKDMASQSTLAHGAGLPGRVWAAGQPVWIPYTRDDPDFKRIHAAKGANLRAALGSPIGTTNAITGVLLFFDTQSSRPDRDALQLLAAIGSQVGQFIEKDRAIQDLRQCEAYLRSIFDQVMEGIVILDNNGTILSANPAASQLFGLREEQIVNRLFFDFSDQARQDEVSMAWQDFLRTGKQQGLFRLFRPDGSARTLDYSSKGNFLPGRHLSVLRDVTEARRMAKELREKEELFRGIVESVKDYAIFMLDVEGKVASWNAGAERVKGYRAEEVVGRHFSLFYTNADVKANKPQRLLEIAAARGHAEDEGWRVRKDGSRFWADIVLTAVYDKERKLSGFSKMARDVTKWRKAEVELRMRVRQQAVVAELGQIALAGVDLSDFIEQIATLVAGTLRVEYCEVLELLPDRSALLLRAGVGFREGLVGAATVGAGTDSQAGYTLLSNEPVIVKDLRAEERFSGPALLKDHGVVSGMSVAILGQERPFGVLGAHSTLRRKFTNDDVQFLRSVANVLATAIERNQLTEQLMQWQRMDAVGRLAAGVAHDLKNLFIIVSGYTDLILRAIEPENAVRADVEGIHGAIDRAAALTQQLLVLGRNQPLQTKILDFNSLVGNVGSMLEKVLGPLYTLVVRTHASMPHVKADAGKLEQVLLNLTLNARDSMPDGGCVTLETSNTYLGETAARRYGGIEPGSYLLLTVSDTGQGMDTKTRSQIFEPFFTTKKSEKGTGLGLSLVYSIVKQSAGHIAVSSEPGIGSTFRIYLPLADKTVEMA